METEITYANHPLFVVCIVLGVRAARQHRSAPRGRERRRGGRKENHRPTPSETEAGDGERNRQGPGPYASIQNVVEFDNIIFDDIKFPNGSILEGIRS